MHHSSSSRGGAASGRFRVFEHVLVLWRGRSVWRGRGVGLVLLAAVWSAPVFAQKPYGPSFDPSIQRGSSAATTHADGEVDQVNLFNGILSIKIPLATIRQRGGRSQSVFLTYNSKLYELEHNFFTDNPPEGCGGRCRTDVDGNVGLRPDEQAGWHLVQSDAYIWNRFINDERHVRYSVGPESYTFVAVGRLGLDLMRSDGSGIDMRWADNDDRFVGIEPANMPAFFANFRRFRSTDSSYLRFTRTDSGMNIGGALQFPDGARLDSIAGTYFDANGNDLRARYGAQVSVANGEAGCDPIATAAGLGSHAERITQKDAHGVDRATTICWTVVQPKKSFRSYEYDGRGWRLTTVPFEPQLRSVRWIELPNGRRYEFTYNADPGRKGWGEVASVTLPTGARVSYTYAGQSGGESDRAPFPRYALHTRLASRTVLANGQESVWGYLDNAAPGAGYAVRLTKPDGNSEDHRFFGPEPTFDDSQSTPPGTFPYSHNWKRGLEFRVDRYQGKDEGRKLMETLETLWAQNVPPGPYYDFQTNNPYERANFRTVYDPSGREAPRASATTSALDFNGNVRETASYDWFDPAAIPRDRDGIVSGLPGANARLLMRTTHEYAANLPYVNENAPRILNRRLATRVHGAAGLEAETRYEYDNYNRFPLSGTPGVAGHDPNYGSGYADRGNITAESRWVNPALADGSTWTTRFHKYDVYGNRVATSDWVGGSAPFSDSATPDWTESTFDATYQMYPIQRRNALGHVERSEYSPYTGQLLAEVDPNGVRTDYTYADPLSRPTRTARGGVTQSLTAYDDIERKRTVIGDLAAFGDGKLRADTRFDELGRPVESRSYETAGDVLARIEYDALGDVAGRTEPFRDGESVAWTRFENDALGRVTRTLAPDSSSTRTDFGATSFTTVDQAGKARATSLDAHGRITRVVEDPAGLAYATDYGYDGRGNLTSVSQGAQRRYFMFDSLGYVARIKHPEQQNNSSLALADATSGNRDWSLAFAYDARGNQVRRTDARGVVTSTRFDRIGRPTEISYGDGTPSASSVYDGSIPLGIGRLWRAERAGASRVTIEGYNAHGQPLAQRTQFAQGGLWSTEYRTARAYNAAGLVVEEQYPSGRRVEFGFGVDAQLDSIKGNLGGSDRTYASEMLYNAAGRLTLARLGTATALYHTRTYNVRSQMTEVRLGTAAGTMNRGALRMFYTSDLTNTSGAYNNGNLYRADHFIPKDDSGGTWTLAAQWYGYDALNRVELVAEQGYDQTGLTQELVFQHGFKYDQYGNRRVDASKVRGSVPVADAEYDTATNRMNGVGYDPAGNVTRDRSSGAELESSMTATGGSWPRAAGPVRVTPMTPPAGAPGESPRARSTGTCVGSAAISSPSTTPARARQRRGRSTATAQPAYWWYPIAIAGSGSR